MFNLVNSFISNPEFLILNLDRRPEAVVQFKISDFGI